MSSWTSKKNNKFTTYLLVLVWPFMAMIMAVLNYRSKWAKNIVWFFCSFFGYNLVIANEGVDANRYRKYLKRYHETIDVDFFEFLSQIATQPQEECLAGSGVAVGNLKPIILISMKSGNYIYKYIQIKKER